jgi:hypothetical protein
MTTEVVHAIAGTITHVDRAAKTILITTARGTVEALKFTEQTLVKAGEATGAGVEGAGRMAAHAVDKTLDAGHEGLDVVAHYVVRGTDRVVTDVRSLGRSALKTADGVVVHVGAGAKTVALKAADGAEHVYHLGERAVVETADGAVDAFEHVGHGLKVTDHVTVHFAETAGRKVAHLFSRASSSKA